MANTNHDVVARKKALAGEYAGKVRRREEEVKESLSEAQISFLKSYSMGRDNSVYTNLVEALGKPSTVPSEYIAKKMNWMFGTVITEQNRDALLYFADRMREYPYSVSFTRRSFRAKANNAYVMQIVDMIRCFGFGHIADIPLNRILNRELPEDMQAYLDEYSWQGCGYCAWQVAYALDHKDIRVEEAVRRILTEENGSGMMTAELIKGILCSQRQDFYDLLGKLLLAARLQEGLRQAICENADTGTVEGFFTILKVIEENNLIRFSSVKRAVGTWLGILTDEARDLERVSEKSVHLIIDCMNDKSVRTGCLTSEDSMKIYIALWSYGFENINYAIEEILKIVESGSHHQLLVAGYFVANIEFPYVSNKITKKVLELHNDKEDILAVWLRNFMPTRASALWESVRFHKPIQYKTWFDSKAEVEEHYQMMKRLYATFSGKTKLFSPCVFSWYEARISKSDFAEILCTLAALSGNPDKMDESCALIKECNSNQRHFYFSALLHEPKTEIQRKAVLEGLVDKETYTRKFAYDIAVKLKLTDEEYKSIEEYLRFKGADIRKNVMNLLMRQDSATLNTCISRLLDSSKEEKRLGGLDMLMQLKKDAQRSNLVDAFIPRLVERYQAENIPSKEKILLDSFVSTENATKEEETVLFTKDDKYLPTEFDKEYIRTCAKTFADYFPDSKLPELILEKKAGRSIFKKIKSMITDNVTCKSSITAALDLASLSKFIDVHKTDTFVNCAGQVMLIGDEESLVQFRWKKGDIPAKELWSEWIRENNITNSRLIRAAVLLKAYNEKTRFSEACVDSVRTVFGTGFEYGKVLPYSVHISEILRYLCERVPSEERTQLASALSFWFIYCVPEDMVMIQAHTQKKLPIQLVMAHLLAHEQLSFIYDWLNCKNNKNLKYSFPAAVASAERCVDAFKKLPKEEKREAINSHYHMERSNARVLYKPYEVFYNDSKPLIGVNAYLFAAYQGIISEKQLYEFLLDPDNLREAMEVVTSVTSSLYEKGKLISGQSVYKSIRSSRKVKEFLGTDEEPTEEDQKLLSFVAKIYEMIIPVVISTEISRGDSPTVYTKGIHGITRIYGANYFAEILSAMGNDTLERTTYYGWGDKSDRKGSLSYLLSVCIPGENDSVDTLCLSLKGKKITTKRLIEAALFSPEWISIIGQYLKIESFESVCYYFMAHMNEEFDDKRKAMIARFTPLSQDELNLGAFDVNWFRSAYDSIGEKEFNLIYDAAKYISDGAKHSRARKYADATLGKFDILETEKTVSDKRNKDLLMAYSLIPLKGEDDICRRYLYIQGFRKESKQFGSQRVVSEGKAVEMALKNLAINAGYSDTMRLTLRMETKVIDDSRELLDEQIIDGVSLKIILDDNGKASLIVKKDGKELKSIPTKLKKHETVISLGEMKKTLTDQYRRTKNMLEQAMEDRTTFTFGEFSALSAHPVVYPMLKNLVLVSDDTVGFISEKGLIDDKGVIYALASGAEVKIAHPFDLYTKGCWQNYQRYLFEYKMVQPFRQVFREIYIKTADEIDTYHSLRYAGNQIQPAKTVATLKSRRWVADIEDGLQKVYYKENIVAQIYALADWFSPADIEAPTLEWVCFSDRKTGAEIKISNVPDILFSEVMRDVDLAVSVAHAGGVDPETSHSTVEMRTALLSFVLPMFRLENVKVQSHHAIIDGKLAQYSVHLGSGVVHQIGGAMIPVLPVHSQQRGKVFLPFVDDDPKTAEIISKVLLFSEDYKIKDPSILSKISK